MKKKFVGILVGILLIATVFPVAGNQADNNSSATTTGDYDWPMCRHDPEHTGYSPSTAPEDNDTLWISEVGGQVKSIPAIVDNRVYVSSTDSKVYCLDVTTGDELWNFTTGNLIWSSPAVIDNRVYVGSFDTKVYCLNASDDGNELWNFTTGGIVVSSPTVVNGKIYFGSADGKVYCVDAESGLEDWNYSTGNSIYSSPVVADGYTYVVPNNGDLTCLNATEGNPIWNVGVGSSFLSSPLVANDYIYIGNSYGEVYCLNVTDGFENWVYPGTGVAASSYLAFAYENVYVHTIHNDVGDELYCLNNSNGGFLWSQELGGSLMSSPVIADEKLYVGSDYDGYVYCLNAMNGSFIWNFSAGENFSGSPAVANGIVYIGSDDGNLFAFGELDQSPSMPIISGPVAGGPEIELNFSALSTDPEGDQVYYMWDWDDGNFSEWLGPFNSSENVTTNYSWIDDGEYEVRVKAKDVNEFESSWSEPHNISIAKQIEITNIKSGFIYFRLLNFNKSFAYIYILDTLGVSVIFGSNVLFVEATASEAVHSVKFEVYNLIWGEYTVSEDNDSSDGFSDGLPASLGLMELTLYAYDVEGNMIDAAGGVDYLVFISLGGSGGQLTGPGTTLRHKVMNRLLDR